MHLAFIDSALVFNILFASRSDLENYNATATLKQDFDKSLIMVQYKLYNLATRGILVHQCVDETASGIQGYELRMCTITAGFSLCFLKLICQHVRDLFQLGNIYQKPLVLFRISALLPLVIFWLKLCSSS